MLVQVASDDASEDNNDTNDQKHSDASVSNGGEDLMSTLLVSAGPRISPAGAFTRD